MKLPKKSCFRHNELIIHPNKNNQILIYIFVVLLTLGFFCFVLPSTKDRLIISAIVLSIIPFIFTLHQQTRLTIVMTPQGISCNNNGTHRLLPWSNVKHIYEIVDMKDNHYLLFSTEEVADHDVDLLWRIALESNCVGAKHVCFKVNAKSQNCIKIYTTAVLTDYTFDFHSQLFHVM